MGISGAAVPSRISTRVTPGISSKAVWTLVRSRVPSEAAYTVTTPLLTTNEALEQLLGHKAAKRLRQLAEEVASSDEKQKAKKKEKQKHKGKQKQKENEKDKGDVEANENEKAKQKENENAPESENEKKGKKSKKKR